MATSSSTAASTSASANSTSNSPFDVFINHRGADVKKTFASYLYHRLCSYGLKVFLVQEELQQGDYLTSQIEEAIQTACAHVAIFSAGYADSAWCLNELLKMLESKRTIIPVFYHVKPNDLRWTQREDGLYAKALRILEEKTNADKVSRHDRATVEKWRKTLSDVSHISGFELEACNGDEGVLLEKVVASVLRKVKKTPLDVAKYPTGLDEKVRDFENKILRQHQQHSGRKAQVVGIVGFGGVGKTTLAKELFNTKSSNYKISCFLDDVRENVKKGSLISLQSKLLKTLTTRLDLQIDNKDKGIGMLKEHLPSSEILLILDDVDSVDQVDALFPGQNFVHPNSLILITSRNQDVLTNSRVEKSSIYKLDGLSQQHSLKLFCGHAFSQPYPRSGFEFLAGDFLKVCDGLPLSLKVIGALLHGKPVSYWENQLCQLKKTLPHEIQERLKISYDALNGEEKQIFLDIACFFRGHDTDMAIRVWDASGWQGRFGFENLQNKCLVEVVSNPYACGGSGSGSNKIHMHDHLRDLGRSESLVTPPLRFWRIDELLEQSSVITVRGIRMVLSEDHDDDVFEGIQMSRLQLVDTEGSLLEPILKRVTSPKLIWLRWKECPYSSLPPWIPMKNLRVLQVSGYKLKTLWELESQLPVRLEELRVDGCTQLKSIRGLEQATKLRLINVGGCSELEELPCMGTWASLEELWAEGCARLKSIRGLEQATRLRLIDVGGCSELEELPCMGTWASLEELWAEGCARLKSIRGLEQARKLRVIDVRGCSELEELPCMETWESLEVLWAEGCAKLKSIRGLLRCT